VDKVLKRDTACPLMPHGCENLGYLKLLPSSNTLSTDYADYTDEIYGDPTLNVEL